MLSHATILPNINSLISSQQILYYIQVESPYPVIFEKFVILGQQVLDSVLTPADHACPASSIPQPH